MAVRLPGNLHPSILRGMSAGDRRLASFLFLDIVGSTRIASAMGDERWKTLLNRFRRTVRAELKRFGGHEEDTAGDGFFASFPQPASAVRASAAIVREVQSLGIDVRCGVHTGEGEVVDGRLAGLGVHVAARVMALGGAAEVLATSTVKDLVLGADLTFADRGAHELKGVPGTWQVYTVTAVDAVSVAEPLAAEVAEARLADVTAEPVARRSRWIVGVAAAAAFALAVAGVVMATRRGDHPAGPVSVPMLIRYAVTPEGAVHRAAELAGGNDSGWIGMADGTLWEASQKGGLVSRDVETGRVVSNIPWPAGSTNVGTWGFGFGSAWIDYPNGLTSSRIFRIDTASGRQLDAFTVPGEVLDIESGTDGVWMLSGDGALRLIDPAGDRVTGRWTIHGYSPGLMILTGADIWISDEVASAVYRFDIAAGRVTKTASVESGVQLLGVDDVTGTQVWVASSGTSTITPIDIATGRAQASVGVGGPFTFAAVGLGAVWVAAGPQLVRYDIDARTISRIAMPAGFLAGQITVDPTSGSVWIGNCPCPDFYGVSAAPSS